MKRKQQKNDFQLQIQKALLGHKTNGGNIFTKFIHELNKLGEKIKKSPTRQEEIIASELNGIVDQLPKKWNDNRMKRRAKK